MPALLQLLCNFQLILRGYICPILGQNGGEGVCKGEEELIPQVFNIYCGLGKTTD
jgi:hypothetical protein